MRSLRSFSKGAWHRDNNDLLIKEVVPAHSVFKNCCRAPSNLPIDDFITCVRLPSVFLKTD